MQTPFSPSFFAFCLQKWGKSKLWTNAWDLSRLLHFYLGIYYNISTNLSTYVMIVKVSVGNCYNCQCLFQYGPSYSGNNIGLVLLHHANAYPSSRQSLSRPSLQQRSYEKKAIASQNYVLFWGAEKKICFVFRSLLHADALWCMMIYLIKWKVFFESSKSNKEMDDLLRCYR